LCIDNARLYTREHTAAVTLQHSLLPRDIPPVPGLDIAYRYRPASQAAEVGGDWFDVILLEAGQVALVVGDVTGHGIHAAALMGQLRTTTTALARLGHPPDQIMAKLSEVVAAQGDDAGATCLYVAYDPASRRCRLTSAGHLPPALRRPDGAVEFLQVPGGVLLGVGQGRYPATETDLPVGSVLALYTDGLIEQPGQDIGTGMSRLARALAASPASSADQLCHSVLAKLGAHARDDIALLLARTTAQPEHPKGDADVTGLPDADTRRSLATGGGEVSGAQPRSHLASTAMTTATPTAGFLHLVVGYDGSPPASRALDGAVRLLQGRIGRIDVVYVAHLSSLVMLSPGAIGEMEKDFDQIEQELRAQATAQLRGSGAASEFERREGIIADQLIAAATAIGEAHPGESVAIMVGSSSHATHRVVGSVAVGLARRSPVPLIIMP
jgi:nucleotide-binding universal stress UspA family protein